MTTDSEIPRPVYPRCAVSNRECVPAAHVAAGAAWLDLVAPGWERKVDLGTLEITDPDRCVCGQVVPISSEAKNGYEAVFHQGISLVHLGFVHSSDQDAWVELIKERFETGQLSDADEHHQG